jgi:hypothetical protein
MAVSYWYIKACQFPNTRISALHISNTTNNPDDRQCMWDFKDPRHKTTTEPRRTEDSKQEKHIRQDK